MVIGRFAVKVPRPRAALAGMRCNRWEREMWATWRPIFKWENLCPIAFADPFGFLVVMPRAEQPVTFDEVVAATPDYYPDITSETKAEDFGRVNGRVLALDYGLPDADMVRDRRAYYVRMSEDRR
jgi:hypothetical protein